MTPIKLSRKSLMYHVLSRYANVNKAVDTCALRLELARATLNILFIIIIGATAGLFIADTVVWIIAMLVMSTWIMPSVISTLTIIGVIALSIMMLWAISADAINKRRARKKASAQPSAITATYHSLKEKYCAPVEFE
jgi:uncharacterized protein (DUF983 family)